MSEISTHGQDIVVLSDTQTNIHLDDNTVKHLQSMDRRNGKEFEASIHIHGWPTIVAAL
jgi:hypothetical protein